jgi:hypothetical protein
VLDIEKHFFFICQQRSLLCQLIHNEFLVTKGCEGKETGLMGKINMQCSETNGHFVYNSEKIGKSFIITQIHD